MFNAGESLEGKWLTITDKLENNPDLILQLGRYKVDSDKPTADRRYRDIVAYDAMYDIISTNVADWYNTILPDADSTVTMKAFRDSFMEYFGLEQEVVVLINDDMVIERTIAPSELSGRDVITAICELNACFGHIGRDGKFQYIMLQEYSAGLYPSKQLYPSRNLYPSSGNTKKIRKQLYSSCTYEDFETEKISKLQIRQTADDIGAIVGTGTNCYIIEDNFLVYGKAPEELNEIAQRIFEKVSIVTYRPFNVKAMGNPTIEVGTAITIMTSEKAVSGYILQRTLKGIQALTDTYEAQGKRYQSENVNAMQKSIIQLKGKTNRLERTVEETKLTISDLEKNLESQFSITAEAITQKVSKGNIISEINQTAEEVTISASKIDLIGIVNADEFTSKYATIQTLNAMNMVVSGKLDANQFNANNINAMKIAAGSVAAENITGTTISGKHFVGGEIRSNNYAASSSAYACGGGMRIDLTNGNIWWANGSIKATTGFMYSTGYESFQGYNMGFKNILGLLSTNSDIAILGSGFSDVRLKSGASITSLAESKENIIPCVNALSALENTDVYYFNYKDDTVKRSEMQKVGFIIGDGYNLDSRLLSKGGDAIDIYNAIGLNWRATQQLYTKIKKIQEQINSLLEV